MKKLLFITTIIATVFVSACKKDNETNLSSAWAGVYKDASSGLTRGNSTALSLNNIIISQIDASTMKVQIKAIETNYIYTYTTLNSVTLNGTTKATIDEMVNLTESTGQYHITGTMTMTGGHVVLSATATNMAATQETDVKTLNFSGDKKQ